MSDAATPNAPTLACQRQRFELPDDLHYLNGAYMSPLSTHVLAAGESGLHRKAVPNRIQPDDFFTESDRSRALFGELIGASAEHIALMPSVSYGVATVAKNLAPAPGDNLVVLDEQFPSNVYGWRSLAADSGASLRTVEAPAALPRGEAWNHAIMDTIDARTAAIALPPVHWTDGTRFDLAAIGAKARAVGAALIVDGTQSLGAQEFDVRTVQPDALLVSAYKWLMGPYGMALAYYGPRLADGRPLEQTWLGRAGAEDFSQLVDYRDDYSPGMRRFDMGGRASPIHLPMLNAALEEILDHGVAARREYCEQLVEAWIPALTDLGIAIEPAAWRAAHLFGLRLPAGVDIQAVERRLAERQVIVSVRGSAVRVSPNVYNDARDMAALVDALRAALSDTP